jgi:dTDP-4-amino-4,6-dideoxygalactose transaminase
MEKVKLVNGPLADYRAYKEEIKAAVDRVLESGWYILGSETAAFEKEFAGYLGTGEGIGVGSGTEALHLALLACGIGKGDEVITVSHTAVATVAAIEMCGARPVLVDIDAESYTMDAAELEKAITKKTKAVVPVHLYGHPAEIDAITAIAKDHGFYVLEDCAQSHGATFGGRMTGVWGDIAAFSFYPTKNLGALGDGGFIATARPELAEKVRLLREYGWRQRYMSEISGFNSRLDELQAAILRVKLSHLEADNGRRIAIARHYDRLLGASDLTLPREKWGVRHVYHQYVVRSKRRDALKSYLKEHGVDTLIHYPVPVHLQPAYRGKITLQGGRLPVTEEICPQILSLPMHPHLTGGQIEQIAELITGFHDQV